MPGVETGTQDRGGLARPSVAGSLLERLQRACATDHQRAWLCKPFLVGTEPMVWTAASNGHILVAVHGAHVADRPDPHSAKNVAGVLKTAAGVDVPVSAEHLAAWAGEEQPRVPCAECGGKDQWCDVCGGDGTLEAAARPGRIIGLVVNRDQFARVLSIVAATGSVRLGAISAPSGNGKALAICGEGWRAAVMEMVVEPQGEEFAL
jgi:hypothetical protein